MPFLFCFFYFIFIFSEVFHWHTLRNSGRLADPAQICCRLALDDLRSRPRCQLQLWNIFLVNSKNIWFINQNLCLKNNILLSSYLVTLLSTKCWLIKLFWSCPGRAAAIWPCKEWCKHLAGLGLGSSTECIEKRAENLRQRMQKYLTRGLSDLPWPQVCFAVDLLFQSL